VDFIKRHYEKVILLGLFVLFVGLMFLVQSIISSTRSITEKDLKLPKRTADHVNADVTDPQFDTAKIREATRLVWGERKGQDNEKDVNPDAAVWADFVTPFEMASCPHCQEGKIEGFTVLIPAKSFPARGGNAVGKCPQCGKELKAAPEISLSELEEVAEKESDKDNDGILDEIESQYGMSSDDPNDARYDLDGDGFSNKFEIDHEFLPNDPTSHPPYWWRLQIRKIEKIELKERFMLLSDNGLPNDKSEWQLQFNLPDRLNRRDKKGNIRIETRFFRVGDTVTVDGRKYKIADAKRILIPIKDARVDENSSETAKKGFKDASRVFLQEIGENADPKPLVMVANEPAFSNDKRPVLYDSGDIRDNRRDSVLKIGDTIRLYQFAVENNNGETGSKRRGNRTVATYRLKSVDDEKNAITLESVGKKKKDSKEKEEDEELIVISMAERKVPSNLTPIKKVERTNEESPEGDETKRAIRKAPRKRKKN